MHGKSSGAEQRMLGRNAKKRQSWRTKLKTYQGGLDAKTWRGVYLGKRVETIMQMKQAA